MPAPKKLKSKVSCISCGGKTECSVETPFSFLNSTDIVGEIKFVSSSIQTELDRAKLEIAPSVAIALSKYDTPARGLVKDLLCSFCKGLMEKSGFSTTYRNGGTHYQHHTNAGMVG